MFKEEEREIYQWVTSLEIADHRSGERHSNLLNQSGFRVRRLNGSAVIKYVHDATSQSIVDLVSARIDVYRPLRGTWPHALARIPSEAVSKQFLLMPYVDAPSLVEIERQDTERGAEASRFLSERNLMRKFSRVHYSLERRFTP